MIDPRASLDTIRTNKAFWVEFNDPERTEDKIRLKVEASPRQQRRIIDRNTHILADPNREKEKDEGKVEYDPDWIAMSKDLSAYIIEWEGLQGDFEKKVIVDWLAEFPRYGISFAKGFQAVLDKYEADMTKRKEDDIKN